MSGVAAATIGVGLVSSYMGAQAADSAASTQANAARGAMGEQRRQYDQTRKDQEPWRQAGEKALTGMQDQGFQKDFSMADYEADPGYAFRMAEGQKALERSASARGNLMGSGTMKSLARYSQGVASDEYGKAYDRFNNNNNMRFNRLASLAGTGQTAVNQTAAAGQNMANNNADLQTQIGNAQAAGQVGSANAITSGISNGIGNWMTMSQMNKKAPTYAPDNGVVSKQKMYSGDW